MKRDEDWQQCQTQAYRENDEFQEAHRKGRLHPKISGYSLAWNGFCSSLQNASGGGSVPLAK